MLSVSTQFTPTDEKEKFEAMLESVSFADEIVVFAYAGSDKEYLSKLAKKYKLKVVDTDNVSVVEIIRKKQVQKPSGDWVFIIDFDEIVTPALKQEIKRVVAQEPFAYAVKRRNFSLGFPLKYGGWGDDYVIRLFHKDVFVDWPTNIHSTPVYKGELRKLENYLEHHKDSSLTYIVNKTNRYSDTEAKQFYDGGLPMVTSLTLIRKTVMEFIRRYFFKLGFLDGKIGLIQSMYQGFSVFISYAKLYEKQINRKTDGNK